MCRPQLGQRGESRAEKSSPQFLQRMVSSAIFVLHTEHLSCPGVKGDSVLHEGQVTVRVSALLVC